MSGDDRDPRDELLDRARSMLDRRKATLRAVEDRHQRLRAVPDGAGEGEGTEEEQTPAGAFRERLEARLASRKLDLRADGTVTPRRRPPGGDAA